MDLKYQKIADHVVLITFNRPERSNALGLDQIEGLRSALGDLVADLDVRVAVLTGAGRNFCAGLDLKGFSTEGPSDVTELLSFQRRFSSLVKGIRENRVLLVGAVNGAAFGAGLALALACDTLVAGPDARFNVGTINVGLSAGECGITYHLPRAIGWVRSNEILLTGRDVLAEEAHRIGLVCEVAEDPVEGAVAIASRMAAHGGFALTMSKEVIWNNLGVTNLDQALQVEDRTQVLTSLTGEVDQAAKEFAERSDRS